MGSLLYRLMEIIGGNKMTNLKELKKQRKEVKEKINTLSTTYTDITYKIDEIEYGVKIEDKINYEGKNYVVSGYGMFWLKGKLIKKDGSVSERQTHLYNVKRKRKRKGE